MPHKSPSPTMIFLMYIHNLLDIPENYRHIKLNMLILKFLHHQNQKQDIAFHDSFTFPMQNPMGDLRKLHYPPPLV